MELLVIAYALIIQWVLFFVCDPPYDLKAAVVRLIAHHECGHACLSWSSSNTSSFTSVTIEAPDGGGLTKWMFIDGHSTADAWISLTISLAGMVAEQMFLGTNSLAEADLKHAQGSIDLLTKFGSSRPPWPVQEPTQWLWYGRTFDNATEEQHHMLGLAEQTARNVITAYGSSTTDLYNALLERKTLIESDVERILGSREHIKGWGNGWGVSAFIVPSPIKEAA